MFLLVFVAAVHAFSSGEQQLLSSCSVCASDYGGLSCCGAWTLGYLGSVVVEHGLQGAQAQLCCMGMVVPCHVGSSWTRDRTHVPCTGRWILNHQTTKEGEGNGTPLQYSCLENPMDGGVWWAAVHGVAKSRTRLSDFPFTFHFHDWRRKWQPAPVFLPGESQGQRSLWAAVCRVAQSQTRLMQLSKQLQQEPGSLQSMGSQRVGHDCATSLSLQNVPLSWYIESKVGNYFL